MDKADQILAAINQLATSMGERMDRLEAGQTKLEAGQVGLEARQLALETQFGAMRADMAILRGDIEQTRREVSGSYFRIMGRIDQLSDQLRGHLSDHAKPAAE